MLALTGTILFPLFIALDYILYPEHLGDLALTRLCVTFIALGCLAGLNAYDEHPKIERYSLSLTAFLVVVYAVGLDILIVTVGGLHTPYYAGLTLLIIVLASAVPIRTGQLVGFLAVLFLQVNLVDVLWVSARDYDLTVTANFHLGASALIGILINVINQRLRLSQFIALRRIEQEKGRNEGLLFAAMPKAVASELLESGRFAPRHIPNCTVVFSDFVGFTRLASRVSPSELVHGLDQAFSHFDDISLRHGLERIKTMGDSYMCAAAVLAPQPDHLIRSLLASLEMLDVVEREGLRGPDGTPWRMRVGLHSGPVVAGVVGSRNFAYDLWGDAVNIASRMESTAEPGTINMATDLYEKVERFFVAEDRGYIPVRGKGPVAMSQILRLRPRYAFDERGRLPNDDFFRSLEKWLTDTGEHHENAMSDVIMDTSLDVSPNDFDPVNAFAMLIPEDQTKLSELAVEVPVSEGEMLFREGQDLSVLYLVIRGLFGVRLRRGGVDIEVAVLGPGELLGELSFVSLEPASATVVALSDSAVLKFDLNHLQRMHTEHPGFSARLFHSFALRLARRVRVSNARLFSMGAEQSLNESEGQGAVTTPHIPTNLIAAVGDMQRKLRPFLDGTKDEQELPDGQVGNVCDQLKHALAMQSERQPDELHDFGTVVRREAYRFLMRSKLIQLAQGQGVTSHAVLASIRDQRLLSKNRLGQQAEEWFFKQPYASAVNAGCTFIGEYIKQAYQPDVNAWRVTSLARGSTAEVFHAIDQLGRPQNLRVTCVDDHIEALSAAGQYAEKIGMTSTLSLVRIDVLVKGMIRSRLRLVPQDLIFFQSLVQEVSEEALLDLMDEVHALLAPGGVFLLGQIHLPQDAHLFMEHVLGMPVTTWSVEVLSDLAQRSAFGSRFEWVAPEGETLCSFLELRRGV